METTLKDQFITLWDTYFPQAGLPIAFEYSADTQNLPVVEAPKGHRCIIAQLTQVQRGKTLCIQADSVGCRGGKRYTSFTDKMFPGFECFLSQWARRRRTIQTNAGIGCGGSGTVTRTSYQGGKPDFQALGQTGSRRHTGSGYFLCICRCSLRIVHTGLF